MTKTMQYEAENICERLAAYSLLAVAGGICGGYGVVSCGHTFPLAQTGNIIGMWEVLAGGDWLTALFHFMMLVFFLIGMLATVLLPEKLEKIGGKKLTYGLTLLVETLCVAACLFFPESLPGVLRVGPIFFLSALQYNIFKKCEGVATSTLFCTNNFRQLTISFWDWRKGGGQEASHRMLVYGMILLCYSVGVLISCFGMVAGRWILLPAVVLYLLLMALSVWKK